MRFTVTKLSYYTKKTQNKKSTVIYIAIQSNMNTLIYTHDVFLKSAFSCVIRFTTE